LRIAATIARRAELPIKKQNDGLRRRSIRYRKKTCVSGNFAREAGWREPWQTNNPMLRRKRLSAFCVPDAILGFPYMRIQGLP
jgi:hypothetical protein